MITITNTTNILTRSSSKLNANKTKREKYPKKYCSVMLSFRMTVIFCSTEYVCAREIFAPNRPKMIKSVNKIPGLVLKLCWRRCRNCRRCCYPNISNVYITIGNNRIRLEI